MSQKINKIILLSGIILIIFLLVWGINFYQAKQEELLIKKYEKIVSRYGKLMFQKCILNYLNSYKAKTYRGWEGICDVQVLDFSPFKFEPILRGDNHLEAISPEIKVLFFDLTRMKQSIGLNNEDRLVIKSSPYNNVLYGYATAIREDNSGSYVGYNLNNLYFLDGVSVYKSINSNLSHFYHNILKENSIIGFVGVFKKDKYNTTKKVTISFFRVPFDNPLLARSPVKEVLINLQNNYPFPEIYQTDFYYQ